jgi:hypothetical protein
LKVLADTFFQISNTYPGDTLQNYILNTFYIYLTNSFKIYPVDTLLNYYVNTFGKYPQKYPTELSTPKKIKVSRKKPGYFKKNILKSISTSIFFKST